MYLQNPLTKTQDEPLFFCFYFYFYFHFYDDVYAEVPSLVKLRSVILLKACDPRAQPWPRFCLTLREFVEVLIYPKHGSKGLGMAEIVFNP